MILCRLIYSFLCIFDICGLLIDGALIVCGITLTDGVGVYIWTLKCQGFSYISNFAPVAGQFVNFDVSGDAVNACGIEGFDVRVIRAFAGSKVGVAGGPDKESKENEDNQE